MRSRVVSEAVVFTSYIVLSAVMTWPLVLNLDSAVTDPGDPYLVSWIIDWDLWAVRHDLKHLFHPTIFHPDKYGLAFSEHLLGVALLCAPFRWLGFGPITTHNIALLLSFATSGYGAFVLCRLITRSVPASFVGGIVFAFVPYRFDHLSHLHLLWAGWLPLLLAALLFYFQRPSIPRAALFGGAFFWNGLSSLHWFIFGSFAIVVTGLLLILLHRDRRKVAAQLLITTVVATLLLLPTLYPYAAARDLYGMKRYEKETRHYSADWSDWFSSPTIHPLYGGVTGDWGDSERRLFPGIAPILLAFLCIVHRRGEPARFPFGEVLPPGPEVVRRVDWVIGVAFFATCIALAVGKVDVEIAGMRLRSSSGYLPATILTIAVFVRVWLRYPGQLSRSLRQTIRQSAMSVGVWCCALWLILGVLGSLGLRTFFYTSLFKLYVFRGIRVPARFAMIAYVGLAGLAAVGVLFILGESRRRRIAMAVLVVLVVTAELLVAPVRWYVSPEPSASVYTWLARTQLDGAVIELPISLNEASEFRALLNHSGHRQRLINGTSGFEPPKHRRLVMLMRQQPIPPELLEELIEIDTAAIVVHADELREHRGAITEWLRAALDSGALVFVQRFDHGIDGDYVFAIPAVDRDLALRRASQGRDGAGYTPKENLQRFLLGQPTFSAVPLGVLESPSQHEMIHGPLAVCGWALAPFGVREVNIRFANGHFVQRADFVDRGDIRTRYPWYPTHNKSGFCALFRDRPFWTRAAATDAQVEIVDMRGTRVRLEPRFFEWFPRSRGIASSALSLGDHGSRIADRGGTGR